MLAVALQGIGGLNAFGAGVLKELRIKGIRPDIISATSGSLISTYHFLDPDPENIGFRRLYGEQSDLAALMRRTVAAFWGMPGFYRPITPAEHFFKQFPLLNPQGWLDVLFPAKLFEPTLGEEFYQKIANRFLDSEIGIITNAFDYCKDKTILYMNPSAMEKMEFVEGEGEDYIVKLISPDGIKSCLQLLHFGDNHGEYDGAYQLNPPMYRFALVNKIVLVTVQPFVKPNCRGINNYFELEDFKLKMMFKNALYPKLNELQLINRLVREEKLDKEQFKEIKLHLIQPSIDTNYFDYFLENRSFYQDGRQQGKDFVERVYPSWNED